MSLKNEFEKWFHPRSPKSYKRWYRNNLEEKLNDINEAYVASFKKSLFDINIDNLRKEISEIEGNLENRDKVDNKIFKEYNEKMQSGIPMAIINKHYVEFLKNYNKEGVIQDDIENVNVKNKQKIKIHSDWPTWESPTEDEIYQLAQITTKYIRFLDPKIVEKITQDNCYHYKEWRELLSDKKINPALYLWESSPCCFPGIRRYAGSEERSKFREIGLKEIPNALKLDDNDFPKQIWSFIFRGKQFNKSGPNNYSLAHLIDHKEYKNRMNDELVITEDGFSEPLYGLYTCPTNTVYIPNSLLKPTDFNSFLRRLLFRKAENLYKNCCNILPTNFKIPEPENEKWDINNFNWGECVGTVDNINVFLEFRKNTMDKFATQQ